jgi:hypothetical protein
MNNNNSSDRKFWFDSVAAWGWFVPAGSDGADRPKFPSRPDPMAVRRRSIDKFLFLSIIYVTASLKTSVFRDEPLEKACFVVSKVSLPRRTSETCKGTEKTMGF